MYLVMYSGMYEISDGPAFVSFFSYMLFQRDSILPVLLLGTKRKVKTSVMSWTMSLKLLICM